MPHGSSAITFLPPQVRVVQTLTPPLPKQATLEMTDSGWKFVHLHLAMDKKPESEAANKLHDE